MARKPDDGVSGLLRQILAKQDEHSDKLALVETLAVSVANLHEDVRLANVEAKEMRGDINEMRGELKIVHADSHDMRMEMHEMRGEGRELRDESREIRRVVDSHSLRFDFLDERVEMLREGTLTAIKAALGAGEANKALKAELTGWTKRVEKLEQRK